VGDHETECMTERAMPIEQLESAVANAQQGDRSALESVMHAIRPDVHALALRYLWHPQDADDATQDILIRVLTGLSGFRGNSGFRTWVYRVACNALLTLKRERRQHPTMSFDEMGEDLARGLSGSSLNVDDDTAQALLLEEVKIGCTLAMLQCLDRDQRLAYILGEIMELDHLEAATALQITPAAYRKRLSRARDAVVAFMQGRCGLVNTDGACRCHRRVDTAVALGRVDPQALMFATSAAHAKRFPQVLAEIRSLEAQRRAAALYRSHPVSGESDGFAIWLRELIAGTAGASR
jgi:RNA polymerase sigma factor (sigma-70 family)